MKQYQKEYNELFPRKLPLPSSSFMTASDNLHLYGYSMERMCPRPETRHDTTLCRPSRLVGRSAATECCHATCLYFLGYIYIYMDDTHNEKAASQHTHSHTHVGSYGEYTGAEKKQAQLQAIENNNHMLYKMDILDTIKQCLNHACQQLETPSM